LPPLFEDDKRQDHGKRDGEPWRPAFWNNVRQRCVWQPSFRGENIMGTILLIILVLLIIGAIPAWPYSSGWGYYPSGGLGLILIIVLILVVLGRI
jgi:hypothetical protein